MQPTLTQSMLLACSWRGHHSFPPSNLTAQRASQPDTGGQDSTSHPRLIFPEDTLPHGVRESLGFACPLPPVFRLQSALLLALGTELMVLVLAKVLSAELSPQPTVFMEATCSTCSFYSLPSSILS